MTTLRVNDVIKDKVLVSRESARLLEGPLNTMLARPQALGKATSTPPVTIDFAGVEGVAPSFLDELVSIFEAVLATETQDKSRCLIIAHPPTRLSSKFEAVARGHGMTARAQADGSWSLTQTRKSTETDG